MRVLKTSMNADLMPRSLNKGEVSTKPSKTVPDQTMSLQMLIQRHVQGFAPIGNQRTPMYDEENEIPDPSTLDLTEVDEWRERLQTMQDEAKSKYQRYTKAKKDADKSIRERERERKGDDTLEKPEGGEEQH